MNIRIVLLLLLLRPFLQADSARCEVRNKMNGPGKPESKLIIEQYGSGDNPFLNFYQTWISQAKGSKKCPMFPSCSRYVRQAFQTLPWHIACLKSFDRLMRCGHELHLYPAIYIGKNIYSLDPAFDKPCGSYDQKSEHPGNHREGKRNE